MQSIHFISAFLLISFAISSVSAADDHIANKLYTCGEPKGQMVEWGDANFLGNPTAKPSNGPEWGSSGFDNMRPELTIERDVLKIKWGNTLPNELVGKVDQHITERIVPISGKDQHSVWGIYTKNATVQLYRFYFDYNLLYNLTSGTSILSSLSNTTPPRTHAAIYISKCDRIK